METNTLPPTVVPAVQSAPSDSPALIFPLIAAPFVADIYVAFYIAYRAIYIAFYAPAIDCNVYVSANKPQPFLVFINLPILRIFSSPQIIHKKTLYSRILY